MKICVLGNSHVASLKHGWTEISNRFPSVTIRFFASRQGRLRGLRLRDGSLVPDNDSLASDITFTSGGHKDVDLGAYDAFVTYGLLRMPLLPRHLSAAVRELACRDVTTSALNLRLCRLIRQASSRPILIGHNPQPAPEGQTAPDDILPYSQVYEMMSAAIEIENAELVKQPLETFADGWHTRSDLSSGSVRLDVGDKISGQQHGDRDRVHMNGEFGRLWIENALAPLLGR